MIDRLADELGLTPVALRYLRAIARCTKAADWTEPGGTGPRCFVAQTVLAQETGITRRTARRIEKHLEETGLVEIRRLDNNHRTGNYQDVGVFLAPLIRAYDRLLALFEAKQEAARRLKKGLGSHPWLSSWRIEPQDQRQARSLRL